MKKISNKVLKSFLSVGAIATITGTTITPLITTETNKVESLEDPSITAISSNFTTTFDVVTNRMTIKYTLTPDSSNVTYRPAFVETYDFWVSGPASLPSQNTFDAWPTLIGFVRPAVGDKIPTTEQEIVVDLSHNRFLKFFDTYPDNNARMSIIIGTSDNLDPYISRTISIPRDVIPTSIQTPSNISTTDSGATYDIDFQLFPDGTTTNGWIIETKGIQVWSRNTITGIEEQLTINSSTEPLTPEGVIPSTSVTANVDASTIESNVVYEIYVVANLNTIAFDESGGYENVHVDPSFGTKVSQPLLVEREAPFIAVSTELDTTAKEFTVVVEGNSTLIDDSTVPNGGTAELLLIVDTIPYSIVDATNPNNLVGIHVFDVSGVTNITDVTLDIVVNEFDTTTPLELENLIIASGVDDEEGITTSYSINNIDAKEVVANRATSITPSTGANLGDVDLVWLIDYPQGLTLSGLRLIFEISTTDPTDTPVWIDVSEQTNINADIKSATITGLTDEAYSEGVWVQITIDYSEINEDLVPLPSILSAIPKQEDVVPPVDPTPPTNDDGMSAGALIGIIIGSIAGITLIALGGWFFYKKNNPSDPKVKKDSKPKDGQSSEPKPKTEFQEKMKLKKKELKEKTDLKKKQLKEKIDLKKSDMAAKKAKKEKLEPKKQTDKKKIIKKPKSKNKNDKND